MNHQNTQSSNTSEYTGHKLANISYRDLSDYSRPIAIWIAKRLQKTNIYVHHITIFHFLLMLLAIFILTKGGVYATVVAVVLILIKNTLDAVDGSLARLRNQPSRVGRFLDSNLDFIGNFLLFIAFVHIPLWIRLLSFFAFLIQGSFFNYYYILFRSVNGGDTTSKTQEKNQSMYTYDNPTTLRILFFLYGVFYLWQDKLVAFIDKQIKNEKREISPFLITCLSINGLGFQYLAIIVALLLNQQILIFWWFAIVVNIYLASFLYVLSKKH